MTPLEQVYAEIRARGRDPNTLCLVVVSKGQPIDAIQKMYDQGVRDFGESRVQELEFKRAELPPDIRWHLIGSLQTKKVAKVVGHVALIHSVDSYQLAKKLSEQNVASDTLLQVNLTNEPTKHGFSLDECRHEFQGLITLPNIKVLGLMTMAPRMLEQSEEEKRGVRACFQACRLLRDELEKEHGVTLPYLSMGMSQDYLIAIVEGATHLRIGSRLFC